MSKLIKKLLFGKQTEPVCQFKTSFTTTHPVNKPTQSEWMQEFRVGMLYDRKVIYLN